MLRLAVWLVMVVGGGMGLSDPYCRSTDPHPYLELGSKTSYEHAHSRHSPLPAKGCRPLQLWMFGRHGTRYPSANNIKELSELEKVRDRIINNYNANKTSLCKPDIDNLQAWTFNVTKSQANQLSAQGRLDWLGIGRRLTAYFPQLLNTSYAPDKFIIRHSNTSRTLISTKYFAKGVFGDDFKTSLPYTPEDDLFIRNYEHCAAWHGRKYKTQQKLFEESEVMQKTVEAVSERLGFSSELSTSRVISMYDMCRFEQAWSPTEISAWCAVFTKEQLKVLEYWEDVAYYYFNGPGDYINMKLACPIIRHLFSQFSALNTNPQTDHPRGFFFFGHENMIDMLDSRLGFSPDRVPLKGNNYVQQANRSFRDSKIVPFAANIIAVLFKCSADHALKVMFLRSEHPVVFPGCSEVLCDWAIVQKSLAPAVQDPICSDDSYCTKHH